MDSGFRTIAGDLFADTVRITAKAVASEPWTFPLPIEVVTAKEKKLSGTTFEDTAPLSKGTEKGCFPMTNSIVNDRTCPRHKARRKSASPREAARF